MIRFFLTILTVSILQTFTFGQDICAEIIVEDSVKLGNSVVFAFQKKVDVPDESLKYKWNSSFGTVELLNFPNARIKTYLDNPVREVKITLEFDGLPSNCLKIYQKTIQLFIPVIDPDRFLNTQPWRDHKIRLLGMVDFAKGKENLFFLVRIFTQHPKSKRILRFKQRIQKFLINTQKISKEKVKIIIEEFASEEVEYYVFPKEIKVQ